MGVQHLLHPSITEFSILVESYFSDTIINPVKEIIGCEKDEDLIMELYNLLIRPNKDFALRWHRDDIPATAPAEEELERLNKSAYHAQWNLALHNDNSLTAVPGSHKRARTDGERQLPLF
jgi:hypothetical protein